MILRARITFFLIFIIVLPINNIYISFVFILVLYLCLQGGGRLRGIVLANTSLDIIFHDTYSILKYIT